MPQPIPAPTLDLETAAAPAPPVAGSGGWLAVSRPGAELEAARLLRDWAASVAPSLPPVEQRLPNGVIKLHHRGHYLSTLYATLDAEGRLRYSHEPPPPGVDEIAAPAADGDPEPGPRDDAPIQPRGGSR
ncbi:MAG TPA: hypothetical protein VMV46_09900 [Thermoanaerobaculia bacterium]|nr:hypothetical protein [Thermoanaerobaculia bacterium]